MNNPASISNLSVAHIQGQNLADQFITDLTAHIMIGDDLYQVVNHYTGKLSDEDDAFLRGFLWRIQKTLEAHNA